VTQDLHNAASEGSTVQATDDKKRMELWWNNNYQQEETELISEKSALMEFCSSKLPTGPCWS